MANDFTIQKIGWPIVAAITISLLILMSILKMYRDYIHHRAPLIAENPHIHYTFLHHIKVVTIPVFRYRISIVFQPQKRN
ncbi:hypothetical protein KBC99_02875 [Candidatus Saccharibacteria bacterium]|nr:hypothetical protein [Candidatus Saccharibacteria bacterium]